MCVCAFLQLSLTSMRLVLHSGEVFCDECACHFFRMPAEFGYGIARQRNCLACYKLVWWPLLVDLPRTRTLLSPTFWTSRSLQRIHSLGYALHMFSPFPFLPCDVLAVNVWCVCVCVYDSCWPAQTVPRMRSEEPVYHRQRCTHRPQSTVVTRGKV
jgi:hypothetical protein